MKRQKAVCWLTVLSLCCGVLGDQLQPADWRGLACSTHQTWTFEIDENPVWPDVYENPGGPALLSLTGSFPTTIWLPEDFGHGGVWRFEDYLSVEVDNFSEELPYLQLLIQIIYSADASPMVFSIVSGKSEVLTGELLYEHPVDSYYWHATYWLVIEPNPDSEIVYIQPRNCTTYLDGLSIETLCLSSDDACIVDYSDFAGLARDWQLTDVNSPADLSGDKTVDAHDLGLLVARWLSLCPYHWPLK